MKEKDLFMQGKFFFMQENDFSLQKENISEH
jgi:hypothetical protein